MASGSQWELQPDANGQYHAPNHTNSLEYEPDTHDYRRYSIDTLYSQGGDHRLYSDGGYEVSPTEPSAAQYQTYADAQATPSWATPSSSTSVATANDPNYGVDMQAQPQVQSNDPQHDLMQSSQWHHHSLPPQSQQTVAREIEQLQISSNRIPHTVVERRYREALNRQIESLHSVLPAAVLATDIEASGGRRVSKASILAAAAAHLQQLREQNFQAEESNEILRAEIHALRSQA